MKLNAFEKLMMNNPLRSLIQTQLEARMLLRLGGAATGAKALEVGCGKGLGIRIIRERFGAESIDAFDLDPRMVKLALDRERRYGGTAGLWVGDVTAIPVRDQTYDVAFDFGIIHHVPQWHAALVEIHRVLKPGARFYAEEVLRGFVDNPLWRLLLDHPEEDRFDHPTFLTGLDKAGFDVQESRQALGQFGWYVAQRRA